LFDVNTLIKGEVNEKMNNEDKSISNKKPATFFGKMRIGTKVVIITMAFFSTLFIGSNIALRVSSEKITNDNALKEMSNITLSVVNSLDSFDRTVGQQINRFADLFGSEFTNEFEIDTNPSAIEGKSVPTLLNNGKVLNMNFEQVDEFTKKTGVNATILVKSGDEYVRIATSVKNDKNERAIGTNLSHASPAYDAINKGEAYNGVALLFGKYYTTSYRPLKNKTGEVIGIIFVGLDVTSEMQALKKSIKKITIGKTGYVFIIDNNKKSSAYGNFLVHPDSEGKNILEMKEHELLRKQLVENEKGQLQYTDSEDQQKVLAYQTYDKWDWTIASGTYAQELTGEMATLYHYFTIGGIIGLIILNWALYVLLKNMITKPLMEVMSVANTLALGDLTTNINTTREDEIGDLYNAMNSISDNLTKVVNKVRLNTEQITISSAEIAEGNMDLSSRTEEQAASLENTATSMEQLTVIIKNNAESAFEASKMVSNSSDLAVKGGQSMKQVVNTMQDINTSSKKIVEIISVIDGIAFQTNILALNAAVEAARAGEQGRGFAVVAQEVRGLAQRSSQAAKEIKQLIEISVANINTGSDFVNKAENTIDEMVLSINNIEKIMTDIAQANKEQSIGIDQINHSISEMDSVTQQNAALVEEAAAAAASMSELAIDLTKTVEIFKVNK
jgi:methyl-accepting chemotaxis protein